MANLAVVRPKLSGGHDDTAWAERCAYWLASRPENRRGGAPLRQTHDPLVLTGHGLCLRVDHGALVVRNGFTHYPQRVDEYRYFRGDRNLPSRIIVVDGSGTLSFDVLSWLSEQNIPLIRINWRGEVTTALGMGHAIDPERVAVQLEAQRNGKALPFAISLIREKIRNSSGTLTAAVPPSRARDSAIKKLHLELTQLDKRPPSSIRALLGVEGRAAFAYFNAWQSLPLRWKGIGRHPIPEDWSRIGQRQSFVPKKPKNNNASHPVNAILNYAYAVLESQVRIQIVEAGYDPTIGLLHSGRVGRGRHDFVLDLMEPLRPMVDRKVLEFVQAHTFRPADFTIRSDGVCRLNPEMAKVLVRLQSERPNYLMDKMRPARGV
jgi:CRISPR-associated protein Cas1